MCDASTITQSSTENHTCPPFCLAESSAEKISLWSSLFTRCLSVNRFSSDALARLLVGGIVDQKKKVGCQTSSALECDGWTPTSFSETENPYLRKRDVAGLSSANVRSG